MRRPRWGTPLPIPRPAPEPMLPGRRPQTLADSLRFARAIDIPLVRWDEQRGFIDLTQETTE